MRGPPPPPPVPDEEEPPDGVGGLVSEHAGAASVAAASRAIKAGKEKWKRMAREDAQASRPAARRTGDHFIFGAPSGVLSPGSLARLE